MRTERLVSLVVGTMLILGASLASAQQPAAAPPPPPPYGPPITLEQAKKVMVGAEAEAKKNNWNVVMVVLDSGGNLVMLQRMDGAQFGSIEVAKDKAYSAVAFRRPTKAFDDALAQGGANLRILRLSGASPLEGGIPIVHDGKLIGAVGVSGVTSAQDAQIGDNSLSILQQLRDLCRVLHRASDVLELDPCSQAGITWHSAFREPDSRRIERP